MSARSPEVAHVAPLAALLGVGLIGGFAPGGEDEVLLWLYPVQTAAGLALISLFWSSYDFGPMRPGAVLRAVVAAPLALLLWVAPSWLFVRYGEPGWAQSQVPGFGRALCTVLGLADRTEGFNPADYSGTWVSPQVGLALRFLRLGIVVPLAEEICWRGYVMRLVDDSERRFFENSFGRHRWRTYAIVTGLVVLVHQPVDWVGAFCFGSIAYWLAVTSKSLGVCVIFHALVNLLLGVYVLGTRQWGYW